MTPEQAAAYVYAQAVAAQAEIFAMRSHDEWELARGGNGIYTEASYQQVIEKYGLHHNALHTTFADANRYAGV